MQQPLTSNISDKHKLAGLDHLRAFAIVFVLLFHYQFFGHPAWVNKVGGFGWTGVDLFFVLSGFLIAGQLFNTVAKGQPISLYEFFIKRFFRIVPPFLVVVFVYAAFPDAKEWGHLSPVWRYLTFTLNFGLDLKKYGTFSHAWSLCVEEQFYLVLPLIFWLLIRYKGGGRSVYLIAALFVSGLVIRFLSWRYLVGPHASSPDFGLLWNKYIYYPTYNRLDALLTGVSIAGIFTFYPTIRKSVNSVSGFVMTGGIVVLTGAYFMCTPQDNFYTCIFGFPLIGLGYGMVLAAIVCPANMLYRLRSWITSQIAALSYSIYLTHKIVIHLTQGFFEKNGVEKNSGLMMLICFVMIIAAAVVMRYAVENPALRARNLLLEKRKVAANRNI